MMVKSISEQLLEIGVYMVYGKFLDDCHQNYLDLFYKINGKRVSLESFKKFITGCKYKRIPNKAYQTEVGISRSTYYRLVNFMESIVPHCWNKGNLDTKRLVDSSQKELIRERILDNCYTEGVKEIWEEDLGKKRSYMVKKHEIYNKLQKMNPANEEYKSKAKILKEHNPRVYDEKVKRYCRALGRSLKRLKKLENRIPLLFPNMNVYNIIKISKKRPCPVIPYLLMIKFTPKRLIERRFQLMLEIRNARFIVNSSLKVESKQLERERREEKERIRDEMTKLKFKRIRAERKAREREQRFKRNRELNEEKERNDLRRIESLLKEKRKPNEVGDSSILKHKEAFESTLKAILKLAEDKKAKEVKFREPIIKAIMAKLKRVQSIQDELFETKLKSNRSSIIEKHLSERLVRLAQVKDMWETAIKQEKVREMKNIARKEEQERELMAKEDLLMKAIAKIERQMEIKKFKESRKPLEANLNKEQVVRSESYKEEKKKLAAWARGVWDVNSSDEDASFQEFKRFAHLAIQDRMDLLGSKVLGNDKEREKFANLPIKRIIGGLNNYKSLDSFTKFEIECNEIITKFRETLSKL